MNIENIKQKLEGVELIDDEELEELKKKDIEIDSSELAKVFVKAYSKFKANSHIFDEQDKKEIIEDNAETYSKLRDFIEDLNTNIYGTHYVIQNLRNEVGKNRVNIEKVVKLFIELSEGEV